MKLIFFILIILKNISNLNSLNKENTNYKKCCNLPCELLYDIPNNINNEEEENDLFEYIKKFQYFIFKKILKNQYNCVNYKRSFLSFIHNKDYCNNLYIRNFDTYNFRYFYYPKNKNEECFKCKFCNHYKIMKILLNEIKNKNKYNYGNNHHKYEINFNFQNNFHNNDKNTEKNKFNLFFNRKYKKMRLKKKITKEESIENLRKTMWKYFKLYKNLKIKRRHSKYYKRKKKNYNYNYIQNSPFYNNFNSYNDYYYN